MPTNPNRCDRIIAAIDACLAEFGTPAPSSSTVATASDPTPARYHR